MNSDYNNFVARVALEVVDSAWWKQKLRVKSAGSRKTLLSPNDRASRLQQRFKSLACESPQPTIKPGPNLAMRPRRDLAHLDCPPKFIERFLHDELSLFRIASGAFVIDR
jgi:hypothetical protein